MSFISIYKINILSHSPPGFEMMPSSFTMKENKNKIK